MERSEKSQRKKGKEKRIYGRTKKSILFLFNECISYLSEATIKLFKFSSVPCIKYIFEFFFFFSFPVCEVFFLSLKFKVLLKDQTFWPAGGK